MFCLVKSPEFDLVDISGVWHTADDTGCAAESGNYLSGGALSLLLGRFPPQWPPGPAPARPRPENL